VRPQKFCLGLQRFDSAQQRVQPDAGKLRGGKAGKALRQRRLTQTLGFPESYLMSNFIRDITNNFTLRLKEEQCRRDAEVWKGSFVESSVIEHLYRYWFESILVLYGCHEIARETLYPDHSTSSGRRDACDVTATYGDDEYWFEIKVAYWNTTYTHDELTSDIIKLYKSPEYARKVYVVVFIGDNESIPKKMARIITESPSNLQSKNLAKERMCAPANWISKDIYCHVGLFELAQS